MRDALHIGLMLITLAGLSACTTADWYTAIQGAQYDKCEKLTDAEDRRRCKAATTVDKDAYDKARQNKGSGGH